MRLTGWPSWNSSIAGIAVIWYSAASSWLASTSTLATVSLSASAPASSSRTGAIMVHGRHHVAQKSTSTGLEPLAARTESAKSASVTSMMFGVSAMMAVLSGWVMGSWGFRTIRGSRLFGEPALGVDRRGTAGTGGGDRLAVTVVHEV